MKYLFLILLFSCGKELKVNDCFHIKNEPLLFKVRVINKNSYFASKIISPSKMKKRFPAWQISSVPKEADIIKTDCIENTKEWMNMWETAIIREYEDRKKYYSKDAVLPKHYKKNKENK